MKSTKLLLLVILTLSITNCKNIDSDKSIKEEALARHQEFYQLKIYTLVTDAQTQITDSYLKEAYLPGIKSMGIKNIGVFKPRPVEADILKKIYVLIPFSSIKQFLNLEKGLAKDQTYLEAGGAYINATHDKPPYQRIESVILKAFEDHPVLKVPSLENQRSNRVYELRSYESATESQHKNKVDMFNAGGEVRLFDQLEFNAVFYGEVVSGSKMPNLMYMTTFSNQESRDAHWTTFRESPEWNDMKTLPQYQNNVSHADIIFLYPTEYSDY